MSRVVGKSAERRSVGRTLRRVGFVLVFLLVVEYLVLPQIAGARKAASLLARVTPWLLVVGVVLEAASLLAYAQLTRSVLPRTAGAPGLRTVLRIDLATLAVSHLVPGGSAAGTALGFRLLTQEGVDAGDAGFALATQGLGSALVLNVLLWLALIVSIPLRGFSPLYGTAALVGAVIIGAFFGMVVLLTVGEARAARIMRAVSRRVRFLDEERVHRLVHHLAGRIRVLAADPKLLGTAVGWAAANWLLDAASLWVFIAAFGHQTDPVALMVAYGLANVVAALPITPGGLGVVEAVLTSTLVGFGLTRGVAILGVISYRLMNFWVPIPAGGFAYLSLRVAPDLPARQKAEELRRLAAQSVASSEDTRTWAARHGVRVQTGDDESSSPHHV